MFEVLHSSAGAGKTHALVKHYLGHCLKGDDHAAYLHVLALTFTNKAAAEMKERVIGYLEKLAKGEFHEGPMRDLLEHLQQQSGVDEATLVIRANAVLGHMLHNWSEVAISTIDAFTRKVVRPFTRDLRLDADLQMTTEQDHYRSRAVEALIEEAGNDARITELLTQACMQLLHEERSWDPVKPLLELSNELQKESAIGPLEKLRSSNSADIIALRDRLNKETAAFRNTVHAIGKKALDLFEQHGLGDNEVAYGKGGILSYFRKLVQFTDDWTPPGPNALKPMETGKWNSGKASASAIAALDSIANDLTTLFQEAEQLRIDQHSDYLLQRAVARELLAAFALHELDAKLEALKREDAVAFFSDLTRRVAEVVKHEPVPFIYERLGEKYRHFLIDEFQDTSLLQWNALLPLIENALDSGGSALLVGDAKQAIYRWRNGEVRLFVELPKVFGRTDDPVEILREATLERNFKNGEPLAHNRRSAQRIINFNNALFGALATQLPEDLQKVFNEHDQRTAHTDQGIVRMDRAAPGVRGEEATQEMLDHTLGYLDQALHDGFAPGDIAILVRGKRIGRAVAEHLMEHGHAVVSPDGLQLAADPAIQLLIDLLRFIHAGEKATAASVLQWQALLNGSRPKDAEGNTLPLFPAGDVLPDALALLRIWLKDHGKPALRTTVAALVVELARANNLDPATDSAVLTLLDEVHSWTTNNAQDIGGFLEHWERKGGERNAGASGSATAVRIMTVHKSKGLQFPVVIVPDTRMTGGKNHGELFWVDPGAAVPELDVALVRDNKTLRNAGIPELVTEEGLRILDEMNLLYVAFTRPEQRLYAYVPDSNDPMNKALIEFINTSPDLVSDRGSAEKPRRTTLAAPSEPLINVTSGGDLPALTIRFEAPEDWDPEAPETHSAFGTAVHAVLASSRTMDDLPMAITRSVAAGDLTSAQAELLLRTLGPRIQANDLAPWFAPLADVRSEAALITSDGNSIRPDRMLIEGDRIRVLEIKTGNPSDDHTDQLRGYFELLRELGHVHVDGAIWYTATGAFIPLQ